MKLTLETETLENGAMRLRMVDADGAYAAISYEVPHKIKFVDNGDWSSSIEIHHDQLQALADRLSALQGEAVKVNDADMSVLDIALERSDEITTGVDARSKEQLLDDVRTLKRQLKSAREFITDSEKANELLRATIKAKEEEKKALMSEDTVPLSLLEKATKSRNNYQNKLAATAEAKDRLHARLKLAEETIATCEEDKKKLMFKLEDVSNQLKDAKRHRSYYRDLLLEQREAYRIMDLTNDG